MIKKYIVYALLVPVIVILFISCRENNLDVTSNNSIINETDILFDIENVEINREFKNEEGMLYKRYLQIIKSDIFTIDVSIYGINEKIFNTYYTRNGDNIYQYRSYENLEEESVSILYSLMIDGSCYVTHGGNREDMSAVDTPTESELKPNIPFVYPEIINFKNAYYVTADNKEYICEEWVIQSGDVSFNTKMYFYENDLLAVKCENEKNNVDYYINLFIDNADEKMLIK